MANSYIEKLIANKTPVNIIIVNGYQMNGVIVCDMGDEIIFREHNDGEKMIYKHAISTIKPNR